MSQTPSVVWNNCLSFIKDNIQPQAYKTWFEPIIPVKLTDDVLSIQVPSKFFYEWLEEHYVKILRLALTKELGYKSVNITRWWQRSAMEGWRPTLKKFIADHPEGVYYLSSKNHAMALVDGVLTDTAEFRKLGNVILTSGEKIEK